MWLTGRHWRNGGSSWKNSLLEWLQSLSKIGTRVHQKSVFPLHLQARWEQTERKAKPTFLTALIKAHKHLRDDQPRDLNKPTPASMKQLEDNLWDN